MPRTLDVYLHDNLAGKLVQDDGGQLSFHYTEAWIGNPAATPLSRSLPLRKARFRSKECRGFFAGVLPEQSNREIIAQNLGISARNDYALLEQIGGECAGAVTFIPAGQLLPERRYTYRALSQKELASVLKELPRRPLLAGDKGIRLSLAGAQDKVAVRIAADEISLPLEGAPSTHILKPGIERFPGLVFNEALCMQLASVAGLPVAETEGRTVDGIEYLMVRRYDRIEVKASDNEPLLKRIHQEDFCQALGIVPEMKYQKEGGPSLRQCFDLLREVSAAPVIDLARLLDAVIYNYLIGNNDAHGKNFSLFYNGSEDSNRQIRLAPFYDLVSTIHYGELSADMAMKIGREYRSDRVTPRDFEQMAEEASLAKPIVRRRVAELADMVIAGLAQLDLSHPVAAEVAATIGRRCENARVRFRR